MSHYQDAITKQQERRDRRVSLLAAVVLWSGILGFLYWYKVKIYHTEPIEKQVVNAMLINFGDGRNGNGPEEPASQDGSSAVMTPENTQPAPDLPSAAESAPPAATDIITGVDNKRSTAKAEKSKKQSSSTSASQTNGKESKKQTSSSTKKSTGATGDGRGAAAVGNLLRGKGTAAGSQGSGGSAGNAGDPLGGSGDGDSKVGVDRKLVSFIPGTMGRGGAQPDHQCRANGTITIAYTVDKNGNVISARRTSGISDPCIVSTSISWVRRYVKAERANFSSTGSYKITF